MHGFKCYETKDQTCIQYTIALNHRLYTESTVTSPNKVLRVWPQNVSTLWCHLLQRYLQVCAACSHDSACNSLFSGMYWNVSHARIADISILCWRQSDSNYGPRDCLYTQPRAPQRDSHRQGRPWLLPALGLMPFNRLVLIPHRLLPSLQIVLFPWGPLLSRVLGLSSGSLHQTLHQTVMAPSRRPSSPSQAFPGDRASLWSPALSGNHRGARHLSLHSVAMDGLYSGALWFTIGLRCVQSDLLVWICSCGCCRCCHTQVHSHTKCLHKNKKIRHFAWTLLCDR